MKRFVSGILILTMMLGAAACEVTEDLVGSTAIEVQSEDAVTIDYLCENCSVTPEDFEGIDFETFVRHYNITRDNVAGSNIRILIDDFRNLEGDYSGYQATYDHFEPEFLDNMSIIIIDGCDGGGATQFYDTTIFDFSTGHICYPYSLSFVYPDDVIGEIDDEIRDSITELFEQSDICNWSEPADAPARLPGTLDGGDGERVLTVVMNDGTVYRSSYYGSDDSESAEEFYNLVSQLRQLAGVN